jgi:hypothetical protein
MKIETIKEITDRWSIMAQAHNEEVMKKYPNKNKYTQVN